jgi:hypothetical protein
MSPKKRMRGMETPEVTEGTALGTGSRRGSQDLTVLAREEAKRAKIASPSETRDATQEVFVKSFIDYLKKEGSDVEEASHKDLKIEQVRMKAELLRDAQIYIQKGSLDKREVAHLMKTDEVVSWEIIEEGSTRPRKVTFKSGLVGIFKSERAIGGKNIHKHEIAAYDIDKLIGLQMVPLTVPREIDGEQGSLQLWVNGLVRNTETSGVSLPANGRFFDLLIANRDRGNDFGCVGQDVFLFDNGLSFGRELHNYWEVLEFTPSPSVLEKARALNMESLEHIDLTLEQKQAFLDRRDKLIQAIDGASI